MDKLKPFDLWWKGKLESISSFGSALESSESQQSLSWLESITREAYVEGFEAASKAESDRE